MSSKSNHRWLVAVSAALVLALLGGDAVAERGGAEEEVDADTRRRALEFFEQGIQLSGEEHWAPALALFEESIRLYPTQVAMFNRALCLRYLDRFPEAIEAFEALVERFSDALPPTRRADIERELDELRALVGRIVIEMDLEGAVLLVDGREVGRSPLDEPIVVTVGNHEVEVRAEGYRPFHRSLMVTGDTTETIWPALEPILAPGTLEIECSVPGANVAIDGERVGTTPLVEPEEVAAGSHTVTITRPGYEPFSQEVEIDSEGAAHLGARLAVLEPLPAELVGELIVHVSEDDASIRVDGEPLGSVPVPIGPHLIDVELGGFSTWSRVVDVAQGRATQVDVTLHINEERRASIYGRARRIRIASYVIYALAVAVLGAGVGLYIWNDRRYDDVYVSDREDIVADYRWHRWSDGPSDEALWARTQASNELLDDITTMDYVHGGLFAGSFALGVVATIMIIAGPRPSRYERGVSLVPSPAGLVFSGTFGGLR